MSYVCCDVMILLEYAHAFTKELYRMHLNKRSVGHIAHLSNNSKIKSYLWSQIQISRQYSIPSIKNIKFVFRYSHLEYQAPLVTG